MFKNHPKGLIGAALSNMGERFGFYIMMAILAVFLPDKFGLDEVTGTVIYSVFYALTYVLALVGGAIADKTQKYKSTILFGLILMTLGYATIAYPTPSPAFGQQYNMGLFLTITCVGLFMIAFGNGMFKGNLQAVVGQLYDNKKYADKRDTGFQLFYMFINIGAFIAPMLAVAIRNWWVESNGFAYAADLPSLSHQYIQGTLSPEAATRFSELANSVSGTEVTDLGAFATQYIDVFSTGFHYAFAAGIVAMLLSVVIFLSNKKTLPDPSNKKVETADSEAAAPVMDAKEIKQRIYALFAVFGVVIFFWFSFHQNGVTLTYFARDYTDLSMIDINLGITRLKGAEIFQTFNPLFVVLLTPVVIGLFGWLKAKGKEPSTPKKIAIGMGIAALAFLVMTLGSFGLPDAAARESMGGLPDALRVTPFLLIGTYLILTVAELFISPLGLSFVSKVAPPQYRGIMQGAWLGATALGNQLLFIGTICYKNLPVWGTWAVFVTACLISMCTMLAMVKWLERVSK